MDKKFKVIGRSKHKGKIVTFIRNYMKYDYTYGDMPKWDCKTENGETITLAPSSFVEIKEDVNLVSTMF